MQQLLSSQVVVSMPIVAVTSQTVALPTASQTRIKSEMTPNPLTTVIAMVVGGVMVMVVVDADAVAVVAEVVDVINLINTTPNPRTMNTADTVQEMTTLLITTTAPAANS